MWKKVETMPSTLAKRFRKVQRTQSKNNTKRRGYIYKENDVGDHWEVPKIFSGM